MKWVADVREAKLHLEIEHDPAAGYYLYVWKENKGLMDDLQDTLEWCQRVALDQFGVPLDAWKKVE